MSNPIDCLLVPFRTQAFQYAHSLVEQGQRVLSLAQAVPGAGLITVTPLKSAASVIQMVAGITFIVLAIVLRGAVGDKMKQYDLQCAGSYHFKEGVKGWLYASGNSASCGILGLVVEVVRLPQTVKFFQACR